MRDKRYQSTEKGLDDLADLMLGRINSCVDDRAKKNVKIKSATVTKVNEDGTVNVSLPDDEGNGFSRIQNQSVYELDVGDSVEIMLKEGSFSNCWVIAKHGGGSKRVNLVNSGSISVTGGGSSSGGASGGGTTGGGDMLKSAYAPNSNDTVEKAFKDEDGNNIVNTYMKKSGIINDTNLDTVLGSGNYFIGTGNTNVPDGCDGCMLFVGGASTSAFQCIFKYSDSTILYRAYQAIGGWNAWKVITATALPITPVNPTP